MLSIANRESRWLIREQIQLHGNAVKLYHMVAGPSRRLTYSTNLIRLHSSTLTVAVLAFQLPTCSPPLNRFPDTV